MIAWFSGLLALTSAAGLTRVDASAPRGFYDDPFEVWFQADDPSAVVYCTTDGTVPSWLDGAPCPSPLAIDHTTVVRVIACSDVECTPVESYSYLFLRDVLTQQAPPDLPTMWGEVPADYEMDPEIVTSPSYSALMKPALLAVPTLSMVFDPYDMWDEEQGIYIQSLMRGPEWERPMSIEWLDPEGSFHEAGGMEITGGASRNQTRSPKHSFELSFKADYGASRLEYPLFGEGAATEFDRLNMRNGYNSAWHHWEEGNRRRALFVRDELARLLQRDLGHVSPRGRVAHLYLNGLYWGLTRLHERPSAGFFADYLGGEKEQWDVLNSGAAVDGDDQAWLALLEAAQADLSDPSAYEGVASQLDLDSFVDYLLINHFMGNIDWDEKNWYAGRLGVPSGQWYFICWDSESTLNEDPELDVTDKNTSDGPTGLHHAMMANPEYRIFFADRIQRALFHDGALSLANLTRRLIELSGEVELPIVAESARWGDYRRDVYVGETGIPGELYTRQDHWYIERDRLLNEWLPPRGEALLEQYRGLGLFPPVAAPDWQPFGGVVTVGTRIEVLSPDGVGSIFYTLDGSDPRAEGGDVAGAATRYSAPVTIERGSTLSARVRTDDGTWSALATATFTVAQSFDGLVINELHYHPDNGVEFFELLNTSGATLDLSGVQVAGGVEFVFPLGSNVAAGGFVVLTEDPAEFERIYGFSADGQYTGALANEGESLSLLDGQGVSWLELTWDDKAPWPEAADGLGPSLELTSPALDPNDPASWCASSRIGGSPRAANDEVCAPPLTPTPGEGTPTPGLTSPTQPEPTDPAGGSSPTEAPAATSPGEEDGAGGCACDTSGAEPDPSSLLGLLTLALARRRPRR